jgi:NAD(P)-dependent dehydrogenase (short-subunit alcohol dehydrogenase family)
MRFGAEGAAVVVADVVADAADAVAKEIEAAGGRAVGQAVDVSDPEQVQAMVDRAVSEFGALDVLMTAAGVLVVRGGADTDRTPGTGHRDQPHRDLPVCRAAIPKMIERGGGRS